MDIEIVAMNKIAEPKPNRGGDYILANFDVKVGPFLLFHCALARLYNRSGCKGLTVWYPSVQAPRGKRGIRCDDRALTVAIKDAAVVVYEALGGVAEEQ